MKTEELSATEETSPSYHSHTQTRKKLLINKRPFHRPALPTKRPLHAYRGRHPPPRQYSPSEQYPHVQQPPISQQPLPAASGEVADNTLAERHTCLARRGPGDETRPTTREQVLTPSRHAHPHPQRPVWNNKKGAGEAMAPSHSRMTIPQVPTKKCRDFAGMCGAVGAWPRLF